MANQQNSYTGSQGTGTNNADFAFTFPSFTASEVKVEVDNVVKTLTTHYTVENHNTTSGGTVRFTTNNIPTGTTPVRIFRQTDVDTAKATFTAGSSLKANEVNDNFKQLRHALQEAIGANATDRKVQPFNIEDGAITSAAIKDLTIARGDIANDAIDGTKIADDSIDSEHIAADSIDTEHYAAGSVDNTALGADSVTGTKIADDQINSEHYVGLSIDTEHIANENVTTAKLAPDAVTSAKIADDQINSEHYVAGSIDHEHLANDAVDGDNIANDSINSEHYVDGSIDNQHLAANSVTTDKFEQISENRILGRQASGTGQLQHLTPTEARAVLNVENGATADQTASEIKTLLQSDKLTASEIATGALDGRYYTEAESDARYFNISTGDTIKDGDTFPDNDTTIATTAAINDRIIDLVDDVGGFVPIANETSFPTANPDVNNGAGTLVSIKAIGSTRTPSTGTVTIANGSGSNTVTITGCGSTVLTAGFGVIVETTSTLHTYAFHRLVPKATEVTTVAGISSNITTVANNTANINAVAADASDIGIVAADGTDIGLVAGSISNVNTTAGSIANVNTTAGSITNVNNVGNNISNVNSVAGNESNINSAVSNASNINSAVSNASNINTVAGSISNVNTTAGSISNVNTVASNINNVNSFFNTYRIGANNPTTSLDVGDLFFNTTANSLNVYTGSAWVDGVTATGNFAVVTGNTFTGSNIYNDNAKAIFGTSSDGLEILHNGSDSIINDTGTGDLKIQHSGNTKLQISSTGTQINGNITVSGNVDGRDVAADGTKLDGIEANAINASNTAITNKLLLAGGTLTGNLEISSTYPSLTFTDTNHNSDYRITNNDGQLIIYDTTNSAHRLNVNADGHIDILGNLDVGAGIDVTGNMTVTGTVDGRDVAADGTKLDGIESGATADQSNAEIRAAVEAASDSNVFTDADHSKLNGIEASATADQTAGEIKTLLNSNALTNAQIDAGAAIAGTKISPDFGSQNVTTTGNIVLDSNSNKLKLGDGQELLITHNGSQSIISDTAHPVFLKGNQVHIQSANGNMISCYQDAQTELFHNENKKLATTSTGIDVTGNIGVSGTVDGRDVASDGSKLDGIESGATADQSASEILTLIKTVDGAGSGLDADTVDGLSSASFLRTDTGGTASGDIVFSGGGGAVTINGDSDIRLNNGDWTGNNVTKLQHHSNTLYLAGGTGTYSIMFRNPNGANRWSILSNGDLYPMDDSTYDIGTSSQRVANGYFDTLYGDGSQLTGISAGAQGGGSDEIFWCNGQNVTSNYTIPDGKNAMSAGPIQINSGVTVTIGSGETWTVV